ncbi:Tn7-like element transposition protein TnsE [Clostridium sp. Marseille-Q7071]
MGLEFTNLYNVQEKGELEEFVEILKLLEKRNDVKSVEIIIGELPEGRKGKRFVKLNDEVTKRKYAIGKIAIMDGREYSLIEIERETRSLSMLILKVNTYVNWNWVYSKVLIGLINESGRWSNESINAIHNFEILTYGIKHGLKLNYKIIITLMGNFYII